MPLAIGTTIGTIGRLTRSGGLRALGGLINLAGGLNEYARGNVLGVAAYTAIPLLARKLTGFTNKRWYKRLWRR